MAVENFTTYTETDPNSHIGLVGTNHIDFTAYANEDAYLYKDKGVNHFGDFEHKIDVKPVSYSGANNPGYSWLLSNDINDAYGLQVADKTYIGILIQYYSGWAEVRLRLMEIYVGDEYIDHYAVSLNTPYYLTIKKAGTALTCKIYSESARTTLLDTLSLVLHADHKFRYIFAADTFNFASNVYFDMDIENLDLQEIKPVSYGYIIG